MRVLVDKQKAGLLGIPSAEIERTLRLGIAGLEAGKIRAAAEKVAAHRPPMLPLDKQIAINHGSTWSKAHVEGDCSMNPLVQKSHCRFTHSWVADVCLGLLRVPLL